MIQNDLDSQFSEALRLRDKGDLRGALVQLEELSQQYPSSAEVWLMLGHLQWHQAGLKSAITSFRRAAELAPALELASLGLFHALWEDDRRQEALAEMQRFVSLAGPSEEYGKILSGINSDAPKSTPA